ncbi:MAG: TIGR04086 family membrane protein [Oscillospiraceae bacterium]|nr:TIGR04086 family membrane protein [Oscillospiraceae bacterium]
MRKKKKSPAAPFAAGMICGGVAALITAALGALLLSLLGASAGAAGTAAIAASAVGSFVCGRTAGVMRRRDGLKIGALCGILFFLPLLLLSLIFGTAGSVLLPIKAVLCLAFAAAGGVVGVNKE